MIKEGFAREMRRLLDAGKSLSQSARMTEMDRKTARKYRDNPTLPNNNPEKRQYRTRIDPFADVWDEVQRKLQADPNLKAYALFIWLQEIYEGQFPDSSRRTFETSSRSMEDALRAQQERRHRTSSPTRSTCRKRLHRLQLAQGDDRWKTL